ncbi:MAG: 50S ribosomal protein L18a [Methanosarcinales archaeon]|nr:50S ribosomal protein L18a [Methanosarcinales archaeon]
MNEFIVSGVFRAGSSREQFKKVVSSQNKKNAIEKVYSLLGSEHGLKRNLIEIADIRELGESGAE